MPHTLLDRMADDDAEVNDRRIYGVVVAVVASNQDLERSGSVQVRFPWMPGIEPWARVAVPMAGDGRGTYFIPQQDDEVLVAFNHGDIREPYIIGSLWNGKDRPPARNLTDPVYTRMIRTPTGHELVFDDLERSITVASATGHTITVGSDKVEVVDDKHATHRITLDKNGITLQAKTGDVVLEAPQGSVRIRARSVEVRSTSGTEVKAGGNCVVKGAVVRIN
jgi:uncharacterized protein involved in type VI secretion and phage assembly